MIDFGVDNLWILLPFSFLGWILLLWLHSRVRKLISNMKEELDFKGITPWRNIYRLVLTSRFALVLCLALLLADPYFIKVQRVEITPDKIDPHKIGGLNVILLLDVSKSMGYGSRFEAARDFLKNFLGEFGSNVTISLVKFSGSTELVYAGNSSGAQDALKSLSPNESYTSIGDALLFALYLAKSSDIPSAIVLVSDGGNNGGSDPLDAAEALAKLNYSIISIQIGSGTRADPKLMKELARTTNGYFFRLDQASYEEISSLAKETARSAGYKALESSNKLSVEITLKDYKSAHQTLLAILGILILLQILGGA